MPKKQNLVMTISKWLILKMAGILWLLLMELVLPNIRDINYQLNIAQSNYENGLIAGNENKIRQYIGELTYAWSTSYQHQHSFSPLILSYEFMNSRHSLLFHYFHSRSFRHLCHFHHHSHSRSFHFLYQLFHSSVLLRVNDDCN